MTDDQIAALCAGATPGPWEVDEEGGRSRQCGVLTDTRKADCDHIVLPGRSYLMLEDAEFIAAARTLVPDLLSRAQAAEARVAELELERKATWPRRLDRNERAERTDAAEAEVARLRAALAELGPREDHAYQCGIAFAKWRCSCEMDEHNAKVAAALEAKP